MVPRITFIVIAAFWVAMNVLLWRAEYDSHGTGVPVPASLVWQKILTAPDVSSLNVFEDGHRAGFCEFFTSVEQEMANLDTDQTPPGGIASRPGYQVHFNGNVSLGDFTNRLTFSGQLEFSRRREWRELSLKLSSHFVTFEIHSLAAEQNVHITITSDGENTEQVLSFADLQNPDAWWRLFAGNLGDELADELDLSAISQDPTLLARDIQWKAHRDRLMIGRESVPAYRLDTLLFGHPVVIYVSTIGEILRVELPGRVTATFDQLGNP